MQRLKAKYSSSGFITKSGENIGQQIIAQIGVGILNDSYSGTVCLELRCEEIAKCCVMGAVVLKEVEVKGGGSWLEVLDLEEVVWKGFLERFNEMAGGGQGGGESEGS